MRKTLAVLALTATLTGGSTVVAHTAFAAPEAAPRVAQSTEENSDKQESDKSGLLGLLGLLGLAGLMRKKEDAHHNGTTHNR